MPVKEKAEFTAGAADPTVLTADDDKEVQVILTNTGSQEARKIRVRISPIFPFSTDGTERYVASLAPGASQNLTYLVHVDKDATPGQQVSGLIIDFEDPQGNAFSDTQYFALEVKQKTLAEQLAAYWFVFALILLIIAFVMLRAALRLIARIWKQAKES